MCKKLQYVSEFGTFLVNVMEPVLAQISIAIKVSCPNSVL